MSLDPVKNFAKVEVNTGYNSSDTSIVLSSGDGAKLPNPSADGAFNLVWWNVTDYPDPADDPNREIVRCTARSSDTLTVVRAQESTSASTKNTGGRTYKMIIAVTKKMIDDINSLLLFAYDETPAETPDGSITDFTIANTPNPVDSLDVKVEGVSLIRDGAGANGYSLSGTTVTMVTAPPTGAAVRFTYNY